MPVGRFLRGEVDARASVFAAELARAEATIRKSADRELAQLRRDHKAKLEAVEEQAKLAVDDGFQRGLAEGNDPLVRVEQQRRAAGQAKLESLQIAQPEHEHAMRDAQSRADQRKAELAEAESQRQLDRISEERMDELRRAAEVGRADGAAGPAAQAGRGRLCG
ncbi:MAG: hypothetical protein ACYCYK_00295 [Candidatus Dormibacteria bacterium]